MMTTFVASCAADRPKPAAADLRIPEPPAGTFQPVDLPAPKRGGDPKLFARDALDAARKANQRIEQGGQWAAEVRRIYGGAQ